MVNVRVVAYFAMLIAFVILAGFMIRRHGFRIIDLISWLLVIGIAAVCGLFFAEYYKMYYYISPEHTVLYEALNILFIYPSFGIMFSVLFPPKHNLFGLITYNAAWTSALFLLEFLYMKPLRVIIYSTWRCFPLSLLFYALGFPIYTVIYMKLSIWVERHTEAR